jgi:leucyl-tRNA synthetase
MITVVYTQNTKTCEKETEKMLKSYNPTEIEAKWRRLWQASDLYLTAEGRDKPKYYCLDFFPYPSGEGLHVGHCRNYIPTDVKSRYMRMRGYNVLHPMGWDAFGEPAEHFAVTQGVNPRESTDQNTANFRRQMELIGTSYDWSREIDSSRPEFYRWTQWFFLKLYRKGLAYRDTNWQWWCPTCQTTLSSHEAAGGVCWRGHSGLFKREIPAWYFRITAYADDLLAGLDEIDWPDQIKTMQRNWIGRSAGCEIIFRTESGDELPVFTTRPDTLYGATFFVLAPEHPLVTEITSREHRTQIESYILKSIEMSEIDRLKENRLKTGVFTGGHVINPINREPVPVYIADYVLPSYGTGAVMGVPAHDERDFEFAQEFDLPVKIVIAPPGYTAGDTLAEAFLGEGTMVNSGSFNGLLNVAASEQITDYLERHKLGNRKIQYRMRDWLISRQRYWGTPIPIVYCDNCGEVPLREEQLPVLLPPMADYQPDGSGRSALARLPEFVNTSCPVCDQPATRETDTMGGFACSSWYFLRFTSPHYEHGPFETQAMRYWMPVDLYVGGAEHAVLHLLYARFWMYFLADEGLIHFKEPFTKLLNQGQMIGTDGLRMSKSRGNVIIPDNMVEKYGADALRVYELFMAPFDQDVHWSDEGINGARRFLNRIWKLYAETYSSSAAATEIDAELERWLHKTIYKVSQRIEDFRFNTLISSLMEFTNQLTERHQAGTWNSRTYHQSLEALMIMLAPVTPYLAEELWHLTGHNDSIHLQEWLEWDTSLAQDETLQIPIQVDGKVRAVVEVPIDAEKEEVQAAAFAHPKVIHHFAEKGVAEVIFVPGKIMNLRTTLEQ